ncbi:MAG: tRNA (adenine-N1)-methyltransferase [Acidimicrobiia bacterium]
MSDPLFAEGESCLAYDHRGKRHLLSLKAGDTFHYDRGTIAHDDIIGRPEGSAVVSTMGSEVVVVRPRLADYVLKMKRGAAVVYPKDAGAIVTWADIAPGHSVVEAGTGSGALTLVLSRAVGPEGRVVTVERRGDHLTHAKRVIAGFAGSVPHNVTFIEGSVEHELESIVPDRVVLDLPEPWAVVPVAASQLTGGGVLAAYLPTVPQVQQLRDAIADAGVFFEIDTFEIIMRSWSVSGRSVRPEHRMVGHTGFITVGRRRL